MDKKKCGICGRFYTGEGYKDACTEKCFYRDAYCKKHNTQMTFRRIYEKLPPKESPITKANARWLKNVK